MQRRTFLAGVGSAATLVLGPSVRAQDRIVLATGTFRDGDPVHRGSGSMKIIGGPAEGGPAQLLMADMNIVPGPNLLVYLAEEPDPLFPEDVTAAFASLGRLKSLTGNQSYDIPVESRRDDWGSVVVWCDTFKTPFAIATIERL